MKPFYDLAGRKIRNEAVAFMIAFVRWRCIHHRERGHDNAALQESSHLRFRGLRARNAMALSRRHIRSKTPDAGDQTFWVQWRDLHKP